MIKETDKDVKWYNFCLFFSHDLPRYPSHPNNKSFIQPFLFTRRQRLFVMQAKEASIKYMPSSCLFMGTVL